MLAMFVQSQVKLFGKNPGRFLSQAGFRIIHYRQDQQDIDTLSDEIEIATSRIRNGDGDKIFRVFLSIVMEIIQQNYHKNKS